MKSLSLAPTRYLGTALLLAGTAAALIGMKRYAAAHRELPTLRITADDYRYEVPAEVPAGPTRLQLVNRGKELHHAQLIRLEQGKTLKDFAALPPGGPLPSWAVLVGGPGAVDPGTSGSVIQSLTPGEYALMCWIPSATDHQLHLAKGMITSFKVTPRSSGQARMPRADATVRMVDFGFIPAVPLTEGTRFIRVINDGPQPHELVLLRLAPGKTFADVIAWGEKGPPPFSAVGGTVGMVPGEEMLVEATLVAGEYVMICFVPDRKDGKPHFAHGMAMPFTVAPRV